MNANATVHDFEDEKPTVPRLVFPPMNGTFRSALHTVPASSVRMKQRTKTSKWYELDHGMMYAWGFTLVCTIIALALALAMGVADLRNSRILVDQPSPIASIGAAVVPHTAELAAAPNAISPLIAFDAAASQGSGDGSPATAAPSSTPAPQLHDPSTDPLGFLSDLELAKKIGWPLLVGICVLGLLELAGYLGKSVAALTWLTSGRTSIVIAGGVAVLSAACNAMLAGGNYVAAAVAAAVALAAYIRPRT